MTRPTLLKDALLAIFIVIIFCCLFLLTHAFQDIQNKEMVLKQTDSVAYIQEPKSVPKPTSFSEQKDTPAHKSEITSYKKTQRMLEPETTAQKTEPKKIASVVAVEKDVTEDLLTPNTQVAQVVSVVPMLSDNSQFEQELVALIKNRTNEFRKKNNRTPFTTDSALATNARSYSQTMLENNFLSHTDKNGCDLTCRFKADGYGASSWGENLAKLEFTDMPTPEEVADFFMDGWEKSSGHRDNLLSDDFERQGIGIAIGTEAIYATVHFAR